MRSAILCTLLAATLGLLPAAPTYGAAELGTVAFANSGAAEAQEPFLKGVAALHSFWYEEAADLFRQSQEADPDFALAYWGEAMTHNHPLWRQQDGEAAREILERLGATPEERAAKAPTEREKAWLETVEILYGFGDGEPASREERNTAYAEALAKLAARFPEDDEAKVFHALALQGLHRDDELGTRDRMHSAAILEELIDRHPDHPGVLHYLIHAYDDPVHAPLGRRAAEVYADVAPAAPHALHMPSHIFVQLGLWERVAASNVDAWESSVAWTERRNRPISQRDFHSLSWLHYAYHQLGRREKAAETLEVAREAARQTDDARVRRYHDAMEARWQVETGQWREAPLPEDGEAAIFAAGMAAAHRGDLATARQAWERLDELGGDFEKAEQVMAKELAGVVAWKEGKPDEALDLLAEAVALEESMGAPSGPPYPAKPSHELYGEILLELGKPAEAAEQFGAALLRMPNRVRSLLGAARAAAALGKESEARQRYQVLAELWRGADPGHEGLAEAKGFLARPSHHRPAASPYASESAALSAGSTPRRTSSTPASHLRRMPCISRHLRPLATAAGEKAGLGERRAGVEGAP